MKISGNSQLGKSFRNLRSRSLSGLKDALNAWVPVETISTRVGGRNRIFSMARTFWLFLYQIISGNVSLEAIVLVARAWFLEKGEGSISPNTSAYSQAMILVI